MAATLVKVTFQLTGALSEDNFSNDFAFDGDANDPVAFDAMFDNLVDFYNQSGPVGANSITQRMATEVLRTADAALVEAYDIQAHLDGSSIGSPVASRNFTPDAAVETTSLPQEVSLCLSFRGNYGGVDEIDPEAPPGPAGDLHPRARRRGRVYLGPWNALQNDDGRPLASLQQCIADAAFRLEDTSGPGGAGNWCVWSRKNVALYPVTTAHVDNAWDTQRRRGRAATSRLVAF